MPRSLSLRPTLPVVAAFALTLFSLLFACSCGDGTRPFVTNKLIGGSIQGTPLTLAGTTSLLAGASEQRDNVDGTGAAARFNGPFGVTTDGTNLYVADCNNHAIRKIVIATAAVTTLSDAFGCPAGITIDGTTLYISDISTHSIARLNLANNAVTFFAGSGGPGFADGNGSLASFYNPYGLTYLNGNLYVADYYNHRIRKVVVASGEVSTFAGSNSVTPADGTGTAAFTNPTGITTDGTNLYVADWSANNIRKIVVSTGAVTTLAGVLDLSSGDVDGTGATVRFHAPYAITSDGTNLYITDAGNNKVRKLILSTGAVSTLATNFDEPYGITNTESGVYVVDYSRSTINAIQ